MIRIANIDDVDAVSKIYSAVVDNCSDTTGWIKGVYPTCKTAAAAQKDGELFVLECDGTIAAAAIINQKQVDAYKDCKWEYDAPQDKVMVLHTLVVHPSFSGRGLGREFVAFYENMALSKGCHYLRMDTNEKNLPARNLYKKLGYKEAGIVKCCFNNIPDVALVCLEKKI